MKRLPLTFNMAFLAMFVIVQVPAFLRLIHTGLLVPTLVLTGVSWGLGQSLRKNSLLGLLGMGAYVLLRSTQRHGLTLDLIDQSYLGYVIGLYWPEDPDQRLKKRLDALKAQARQWSRGIPLHTSP